MIAPLDASEDDAVRSRRNRPNSLSGLPPEDRAPDYVPGPQEPEDAAPDARRMTIEQIWAMQRFAAAFADATRVDVENRGAGYFAVTVYGKDGVALGQHILLPFSYQD